MSSSIRKCFDSRNRAGGVIMLNERRTQQRRSSDDMTAIIDRLNRQHRAQMREMTARGVLYGLVFGAVMLALGISVGSAGLYAVISEVVK